MMTLYCARWVLPVASSPIETGAVAVEGASIAKVGTRVELAAQYTEAQVRDFGEAAIVPGFVNTHSHLELTAMRGYLEREEGDFFAWLKKVTIARLERMTPDDLYVSAAWGAVEAARAGVTCVGDASDAASSSMKALKDVGLRGIVYQESFGPEPSEAQEHFEKLREKVSKLREFETELVRVGVSPHAPYTVSAPQLELIAEFALAENLPLMMHAAESEAETLFMREGRGPFAEGLARRGIEWHAPGISTIQYLARHNILRARPLLAHCITVDDADIETIKAAGASIAHCPKSNAKLGHGRAPFAAFVEKGVAVGFGSDSVASNNTCDILEEARFATLLSRLSGDKENSPQMLSAEVALQIATTGGARALGLETQTGLLIEGAQADIAVVALDGAHQIPAHDPIATLIFSSSARDVLMTMVAGREVYWDGRVVTVDEERLRERMKEILKAVTSDK
ncbi:MAG: 5-methylthioadenosine/S-adenosylhomocysteine deaminase [Acidobacteriota bacterium]|jgi:5-methylthioadenosine/S-adenosylhomocysteine deaminase|nr:5-methylthioadenosine/S-adenosylhomocysteine deaminase [Acidobacteriota bacterium]